MTIFKGNGPWNTMKQLVFSNYFPCPSANRVSASLCRGRFSNVIVAAQAKRMS